MKKIFALLIVLAFVFVVPSSAYADSWPAAVAATVSAAESYTSATRTTNTAIAGEVQSLFLNAKSSSVKKTDAKRLANVKLEYDETRNDVYSVYKTADGLLYVDIGGRLKNFDQTKFYELVDQSGRGFYKLRSIPAAKVDGKNLAVTKSSYSFEKLDGKFYKTQYTAGRATKISGGTKLPTPSFTMQPKSVRASISLAGSGESVFSGTLKDLGNFKPEKAGTYNVEFKVEYNQPHAKGEVVYAYSFSHDTAIKFSVEGNSTNPGEVVVLRGKNIPQNGEISVVTDIAFAPKFFRESGGDMIALLPVSYYTAPGEHYVRLSCGDVKQSFSITAKDKKFVVQNLTVSAETTQETINSQKANDEYEKYIAPIRPVSDPKQYWSGRFAWPLKGSYRVTTQFGTIRYTNGGKTPSRHGAIDFAAPAGTPVYASGAGRVLFSGFLQLTGNTVVIEHGYGLKTWHYHMNSRSVNTGDMVTQGQQIGTVGSTGFSTGAHLHFGMSVNNVFVNPETAITTDLFVSK